jgi:16S rRNA (guanine527-N7)-methyltransferase
MSALVATDRMQVLREGAAALGLALDPATLQRLLGFADLLAKWNRTYNLTAIRDPEEIVSLHLLDSLALAPHVGKGRVLDVGSGGGLPGIPLAIARPDLDVTLIDTVQKKTAFLRQAAASLGLANVSVECARVEAWTSSGPFDWIVSRAFADLGDFIAWSNHLLAADGKLLAMKGALDTAECSRVPAGFRIVDTRRLAVPGLDAERHLITVGRA